MTFRQVEIFLAVARARNFTRAAGTLHLSQSTLSQHVRELEDELDVRLFDRLGRAVTLTEAGRLLEDHATRILTAVSSARRMIDELKGLERGSLVIGASTTPGIYVLPGIVAAFRRRYPGVDVSLRIANSRVIEERIRADEVDLGIVGGHILTATERCAASGLVDELLLIVPPGHPWAARREIASSELAGVTLLMREQGSATRLVTERTLRRAGIAFTAAMELDHIEAIKQAVMAGLGMAFVSVYAVRGELATRRLSSLRLRGLRIERHFHVIHNRARTLTASARAFTALLEDGVGRRREAGRSAAAQQEAVTLSLAPSPASGGGESWPRWKGATKGRSASTGFRTGAAACQQAPAERRVRR